MNYFTWLRDENELPRKIGFERLIRKGYGGAIGEVDYRRVIMAGASTGQIILPYWETKRVPNTKM